MDFADAVRRTIPGTFVPDLPAPERTGTDAPIVTPLPGVATGADGAPSFRDTVKVLLADVNDKVQTSDRLARDLADGRTNDLQKVVTSAEEANLALQFTTAIRQKLLDAYTEISRMQV